MSWCQHGDELDQRIFDALIEFFGHLLERGEALAGQFGVPGFCVKAMHQLDESVTMKELGQRLHVDPSFVTLIADALEKRGLARREPHAADRRIKNLVLTPEGLNMKGRLERAMLAEMPWSQGLDKNDRECFLTVIRKMNGVLAGRAAAPAASQRSGEVNDRQNAASRPRPGRRSEADPAKQN